jgi:hypothetical protein
MRVSCVQNLGEWSPTCGNVGRRPPKLEQTIASWLVQGFVRKSNIQFFQTIRQMRRQRLRVWPVNNFARHDVLGFGGGKFGTGAQWIAGLGRGIFEQTGEKIDINGHRF